MVVVRRYPAGAPRVYHRRQKTLHPKVASEKSAAVRYVTLFDCTEAESNGLK